MTDIMQVTEVTEEDARELVAKFRESFPEVLRNTSLIDEMRKQFPGEIITEKIAKKLTKIGKETGLHTDMIMRVLLAAEKEGWEYVG